MDTNALVAIASNILTNDMTAPAVSNLNGTTIQFVQDNPLLGALAGLVILVVGYFVKRKVSKKA